MRIDSRKALSIADQIFFGARNFIIAALIIKWFGPEPFGYYVLLMTLTTLVIRVHSGLVNLPFSTHEKSDPHALSKYLSRHLLIYAVIALITIIIFLLGFPYKITYADAAIYALGSISIINNELHRRYCLINMHYVQAFLLNIFMCASGVIVLHMANSVQFNSASVVYCSFFIGGLPSLVFIVKNMTENNFYIGGVKISRIDLDVSSGFFLQWISAQCVYYLAFLYIGVGAVAFLGVYRTLFAPFIILVSALDGYLPTRLASYAESKSKFMAALFQELIFFSFVVIAAGFVIFIFGNQIISHLFGEIYIDKETTTYLVIYFVAMTIASCSRVLIITMRSLNIDARLTMGFLGSLLMVFLTMFFMRGFMPCIAAPAAIMVGEMVLLIMVAWRLNLSLKIMGWK